MMGLYAHILMYQLERSATLEMKTQRLYMAFVLHRTLNERTAEKYTRLKVSEKGMATGL